MSDTVNVTVSEETNVAVSVVEAEPVTVEISEQDTINVSPVEAEAIQIEVAGPETFAVELTLYNGNLLKFHSEILATDGDETSFLLDHAFLPGSLAIYKNGILATDEYTEKTGKTGVDFTTAPSADDIYEARYAYV
jgi:hypothetical protein